VLAQYGKESHKAPIMKGAIVRYALCCPKPEAADFIKNVRQQDAETVRRQEELLKFEQKK